MRAGARAPARGSCRVPSRAPPLSAAPWARPSSVIAARRRRAPVRRPCGRGATAAGPQRARAGRRHLCARARDGARVDRQGSARVVQSGNAAMNAGDLDRASAAMLRALAPRSLAGRCREDVARDRPPAPDAHPGRQAAQGHAAGRAECAARVQSEVNDSFDVEQALEMVRAGDTSNGLRDLRAYVDANPANPRGAPAHRQRGRRSRPRARGPGRARAGGGALRAGGARCEATPTRRGPGAWHRCENHCRRTTSTGNARLPHEPRAGDHLPRDEREVRPGQHHGVDQAQGGEDGAGKTRKIK
jgi:hypothetical protein